MHNARSMRLVAVCSALPLFLLLHGAVRAGQPPAKAMAAPALRDCNVTASSDLGTWDDVCIPPNQDFAVLRRGDQFFELAMTPTAVPRKIAKAAAAVETQIVAAAVVDKHCWLFLNSQRAAPCVVDAYSGTVIPLEIPGLKIPGSQAPGIGSSVIVPHAQAAILAVSGGDRDTWPRPGNHSVYFWMDLRTGKLARLPIGSDLNHFSADQRVAFFAVPLAKPLEKRTWQAVQMRTGERTDTLPELRKESHVPYDWTDTQAVKPLYERRAGQGDADFLAGLSVGGRVVPVDLDLSAVRYLAMARANDGFAGFRLRPSGASSGQPGTLWIVPLAAPRKVEAIAKDVTDFALLGRGNVLYVKTEPGHKVGAENRRHAEAYFHVHGEQAAWNVLDGLERLPALAKALARAEYITDRMSVQLIEGFGSGRHDPLVLCLCEHQRGDRRALIAGQERVLESTYWRRALLIGDDGRRCLTPLFREGNLPDQLRLHNSGKLLMGTYVWEEAAGTRKRQVRLSTLTVRM